MPPSTRTLAALQQSFYALVTGAPASADGLVGGDARAGDAARVDVYRRMYRDRLHETLADDYPKIAAVLGTEAFASACDAYILRFPPASYTLRDAGASFARFLEEHSPAPWHAELAALEWARTDVHDGTDATPLDRAFLGALDASEFPALPLRLVPASARLVLRRAVDETWATLHEKGVVVEPQPAQRTVVVWRRAFTVVHRTLEADEARVAADLVTGTTFGNVCEHLADVTDPAARAVELLLRWTDSAILQRP